MILDLQIQPSNGQPIYRQIADHVCKAVQAGRLIAGQKLPSMSVLARQLGVSPLTINRSYEYLANQGIVKQKHGSGTYIQSQAKSQISRHEKRRVKHIYVAIGHETLSHCHNATLFIITDILGGVMDVLGQRETHVVYVKTINETCLSEAKPDDAVLLLRTTQGYDPIYHASLLKRNIRVASMWNMAPMTLALSPNVSVNHKQTDRLACEHLLTCGYRKIGFIGRCNPDPEAITRKFLTYNHVMRNAGLDIYTRYVRNATVTPGQAYAAAFDIVKNGDLPDALFVDTDYKAMEVITALNEMGIRVPEDIGIASYDDIPEAANFHPPLTTVHTPRRAIGQTLGNMLLNWPEDGSLPASQLLDSELIIRASTNMRAKVDSSTKSENQSVQSNAGGVLLAQ